MTTLLDDSAGNGKASDTPVPFGRKAAKPIPSSASTIARASHLPTLDKFQSRYTSEDNASFTTILSKENVNRKRKMEWAFKPEDGVRKRLEAAEERWRGLLANAPRSEAHRLELIEGVRQRERKWISEAGVGAWTDGKGKGKAKAILPPPSPAHSPLSIGPSPASPPQPTPVDLPEEDEVDDLLYGSLVLVAPPLDTSGRDLSLTIHNSDSQHRPPTDLPLPPDSHLALALRTAGLPETRTDHDALRVQAEGKTSQLEKEKKEKGKVEVDAWNWKVRSQTPLLILQIKLP